MDSGRKDDEGEKPLPPPPPPPPRIPPNVQPIKAESVLVRELPVPCKSKSSNPERLPMSRPGAGRNGQRIPLLVNHFTSDMKNIDGDFYHYSVVLKYEDDRPVTGKRIGRRVLDKVLEIYHSDLGQKDIAYDGEKSLFTVGALPKINNDFTVVLEDVLSTRTTDAGNLSPGSDDFDRKRRRKPFGMKTFKVELNFAAKIPMKSIRNALRGQENEKSQESVRILDIILRQHAAKQGCLLVRQSFFVNDPKNFEEIGGGVLACRGFHSSFRATQSGLSLNMDCSTTMIVKPGSVLDFLKSNQNARSTSEIDWVKAKRMLKGLRVKILTTNMEFKIAGLSDLPCNQQTFSLKRKSHGDGIGATDTESIEITVYDYFTRNRNLPLSSSATLPCLNVGKPKRPTYYPLELCSLVSLQRYTKALSTFQRSSLVEKSRQRPPERMKIITDSLRKSCYDADPMLKACGLSISTQLMQLEGRVLQPPRFGNNFDFTPRNGRWNFNDKKLYAPIAIENWVIVIFSARCNVDLLTSHMMRCGEMKGMNISQPLVLEEHGRMGRESPHNRVDAMFSTMKERLKSGPPRFILCILRERKNSDLYGPWKRKTLAEFGIVTQCIAAPSKISDQYVTNVLLKINTKLGGINSILQVEHPLRDPARSGVPTIIFGMDVSHGPPGQAHIPSIAAVVSSREWPMISRYRAEVRTQSPKSEIIDSLFKPMPENRDDGIIRELLVDFYSSSKQVRPQRVIIFRDGVSESQFSQILNIELEQIIEACKFLDSNWHPKFTLIVAQKKHHTKLFQQNSPENVPPGTVVDTGVCHPRNFDFYMCSHAGMIGTTRPTHYHVLYDENGFSADDLQELVHSLSYVYQRSTTAISLGEIDLSNTLMSSRAVREIRRRVGVEFEPWRGDHVWHWNYAGATAASQERPFVHVFLLRSVPRF
ncbi:protein argonaute 4A-like isoform X2 [Wolffia australiana]